MENFGTWRDAEGRLAWGINDFDEAYPLAYANDLVRSKSDPVRYGPRLLRSAIRCPDPMFVIGDRWVVRRLSPECSRVELTGLPKPHDDLKLLHAMGWETANVHLGSHDRMKKVAADLQRRRGKWLGKAAGDMLEATLADWSRWRAGTMDQARS